MTEKEDSNSTEPNRENIEANFYYALSHEKRRKILKIIGDNKYSSFTYLKKELKVSTGTIYHHLDTLTSLVEQKEDKKYYLTDLGIHAYNSLKENISTIITPDFTTREFNSPLLKGMMKLTPRKNIIPQQEKKVFPILISLISIFIGSIFNGLNRLYPFLFFFNESTITDNSSDLIVQFLFSVLFFVNFFIYYIVLEVVSRLFYKKKQNNLNFFRAFGIIFLPIDIYLVIHFFLKVSNSFHFPFIRIMDNIIMILFQLWSLWLLTFSLTVNKQLKIENSLIINLLIHYGGFSLFLLLSI